MSKSYEKVNYLLRLKKQIERKIIIETLQRLSGILKIDNYHYFGLGSVYFADFILFHKYLNISKMTSVEIREEDEKRFDFNIPFDFIDFYIKDCGEYLSKHLNWEDKLFIWLDYDEDLRDDYIANLDLVSTKAKSGDILLITLESENPTNPEVFIDSFKKYLKPTTRQIDIKNDFPSILNKIFFEIINNGCNSHTPKLNLVPIANFVYGDTKKMYSFGVIFCDDELKTKLSDEMKKFKYAQKIDFVEEIDCPILTPKEKIFLDSKIDKDATIPSIDPKIFEDIELKRYARFYKYYPQFVESIY